MAELVPIVAIAAIVLVVFVAAIRATTSLRREVPYEERCMWCKDMMRPWTNHDTDRLYDIKTDSIKGNMCPNGCGYHVVAWVRECPDA